MSKTYYELRQAAYFKAGAAMYDAASAVLNDCTETAEYLGATYEWARDLAAETARKAQALKELALAEGAVARAPRGYNAAQARYTDAVTRHLNLRQAALESKVGTRCECGAGWDPVKGGYRCARS